MVYVTHEAARKSDPTIRTPTFLLYPIAENARDDSGGGDEMESASPRTSPHPDRGGAFRCVSAPDEREVRGGMTFC
jgi:hypothetical protein